MISIKLVGYFLGLSGVFGKFNDQESSNTLFKVIKNTEEIFAHEEAVTVIVVGLLGFATAGNPKTITNITVTATSSKVDDNYTCNMTQKRVLGLS